MAGGLIGEITTVDVEKYVSVEYPARLWTPMKMETKTVLILIYSHNVGRISSQN